MPKGTNNIEHAQQEFNKRYGVDFSIDEFDGTMSGFAEFGGGVNVNEIYRATFSALYKKAYANFVDRKIGDKFDFVEMINEFDKNIMEPYRAQCKNDNKTAPKPYGEWKVSDYLDGVSNYLDDIPLFKPYYAAQRYSDGSLSISDMRNYINNLKKRDDVTVGELSTVDCYISALDTVSRQRSLISKILHPIRYIAEKIYLRSFTSYLEQKTGGKLLTEAGNAKYDGISAISEDQLIGNCRDAVGAAKVQALKNEAERDTCTSEREQISVKGAVSREPKNDTSEKVEYIEVPAKNYFDF